MSTSVIEEFLEHYNREFDHYSHVSSLVQKRVEGALAKRGILAIVTSRAKSIDRLRVKLLKRNAEKPYSDVKTIYRDVIDLAGVRIALYFPGDRGNVEAVIGEIFNQVRPRKQFPEGMGPKPGKRFMGYFATHYLVQMRTSGLDSSESRYANTKVEIQVASVLMHAWAEVEHDLEYKPESGVLSEDESVILDEINGLVLAGELALERLQRAIQRRTTKQNVPFSDQFELASFLSQRASRDDWQTREIGRVDVLFTALQFLNQATPTALNRYIDQLTPEDRNRPLGDVLIDKVLVSNRKGSGKLPEILGKSISQSPFVSTGDEAQIGQFLIEWRQVERIVARLAGFANRSVPILQTLKRAELPDPLTGDIDQMRKLRNELVHGNDQPPTFALRDAADFMRDRIYPKLKELARKRGK